MNWTVLAPIVAVAVAATDLFRAVRRYRAGTDDVSELMQAVGLNTLLVGIGTGAAFNAFTAAGFLGIYAVAAPARLGLAWKRRRELGAGQPEKREGD